MTSLSLPRVRDQRYAILGVLGFVAALAAASQFAIPVSGTPVPITLQPMVVVLAGMMLGPVFGATSMLLYLAVGAAGVPVFAPIGAPGVARFFGPTGGYLIAYPVAAYVAGFLSQRHTSFVGRWLAAVAGIAVLFVGGLTQLAILSRDVTHAIALGLTPFAGFDLVKAFIAAVIARPRARNTAD